MDYKLYCHNHQYEQIINFCADPLCLCGLCATCICEHTRTHLQRGTSPKYENIKNTYARYNQRIRQQIHTIEEDKEWLNSICYKIDEKRKDVKATLRKAREDCLKIVNRHFDDLSEKISNQIVMESKKNSLHSNYRLQALNGMILKEISHLLIYSQDLSSPKFLQAAKLAEEEIFPSSQDFHIRVCKQLKQNEVYKASAIYRQDFLRDLELSLKKLVNLQILLPRVQSVENPLKLQRVEQVRRCNSATKMNSSMIVAPKPSDFLDFSKSKVKNMSVLMPKHTTSIIMPANSNPLQQIQHMVARQNEVSSPLSKGSRLSTALKIIKQSKRQCTQNDIKSMSNSQVSGNGKQNQSLAYSTFLETENNFLN